MSRVDSSLPLMYLDPTRSWITDPDLDHPKGMHPMTCPGQTKFKSYLSQEQAGIFSNPEF